MSITPFNLFFSRLRDDIEQKLKGFTDSEKLAEITRFLSERDITTITAQELLDKLVRTPDALVKDYTRILQELIKDNLEEIESVVALETSITALKTVMDNIKAKTDNLDVASSTLGTAAKQDLQATEAKQEEILTAIGELPQGSAWKMGDFAHEDLHNIAEANPRDVYVSPNGLNLYCVGTTTNDAVYQYALGIGWNLVFCTYDQLLDVSAKVADPRALYFDPDGEIMYVYDVTNHDITQYDLGTAWDISTAVYRDEEDVSAVTAGLAITGMVIGDSGTKLFVCEETNDTIKVWTLSTPWDVTSATYSTSFSVAGVSNNIWGMCFNDDGTRMVTVDDSDDKFYGWRLLTAWDMSTAYPVDYGDTTGSPAPRGIAINNEGTVIILVDSIDEEFNMYEV